MIDYLEQGRTINGAYYVGVLRRLRLEITRKRREKLTRGILLLQDNGPAHTSQIVPHPPYSPDMVSSVNEYLGDQENAFYFEGIRKLKQRWAKSIALKGGCIEK